MRGFPYHIVRQRTVPGLSHVGAELAHHRTDGGGGVRGRAPRNPWKSHAGGNPRCSLHPAAAGQLRCPVFPPHVWVFFFLIHLSPFLPRLEHYFYFDLDLPPGGGLSFYDTRPIGFPTPPSFYISLYKSPRFF